MCYSDKGIVKNLLLTKMSLLKDAVLQLKYLVITVSGESMMPTFSDGEKIVIVPVQSKSDMHIGDIIFFYNNAYDLALHRLVSQDTSEFFSLKGDNADNIDIIQFKNIIGKVSSNNNQKDLDFIEKKQFVKKVDDYNIVLNINFGELLSINLINLTNKNI